MAQYRAEYMVDGTYWLPSKNDFVQRASFGRLCRKADRSRLNGGFGKAGVKGRDERKERALDTVLPKQTLPHALFTAEGGEKEP
jgi:hypothetical protein